MKYFLHDSNAFNDEKISELFIHFGYEGLGLFYTVLEKIAGQEKPIKTTVLKNQLKVGKRLEKCWSFMEEIQLITSNNGDTFNKQLLNYSETYKIKKEKNAKRIADWRERQEVTENVTRTEQVSNTSKVKLSKVNRSKDIFMPPSSDEVVTYFNENNYPEQVALKAFNYYNTAGWKDSAGKQVKNWKQKMISVWFKDENKELEHGQSKMKW